MGANDLLKNGTLYHTIESFFSNIFGTEVILMPSGRAAISVLLKYYGMNRSHTVFAPKWTSHCVWDVITRLANPTSEYASTNNTVIAVHKWGQVEKISQPANQVVIEDSVDSLILDSSTLFPNNGDFEIISLPKTIGSYTGGLILAKDSLKAKALRSFIQENIPLGVHQSGLRLLHTTGESAPYTNWEDLEHNNTSLDTRALLHIESCLNNFQVNKACISKRLELIGKQLPNLNLNLKRLPPVYCVNVPDMGVPSEIMVRNFNTSGLLDKPDFKKVGLIPLHFKASDELFTFCLNALCKN